MSVINKSECKKHLLRYSETLRNGKFQRVGSDVYEYLEEILIREMKYFVRSHPSIGKTLLTGSKKSRIISD